MQGIRPSFSPVRFLTHIWKKERNFPVQKRLVQRGYFSPFHFWKNLKVEHTSAVDGCPALSESPATTCADGGARARGARHLVQLSARLVGTLIQNPIQRLLLLS